MAKKILGGRNIKFNLPAMRGGHKNFKLRSLVDHLTYSFFRKKISAKRTLLQIIENGFGVKHAREHDLVMIPYHFDFLTI